MRPARESHRADQSQTDDELRRRAEACIAAAAASPPRDDVADLQRLVHELHVHQVELEMQNEALRVANAAIEEDLACFTELCEAGPVGYFCVTQDGTIERVNLAGAGLIGLSGPRAAGQRLGAYVANASLPTFNAFLEQVFAGARRRFCEVAFRPRDAGAAPVTVRMEGVLNAATRRGHVAVINVSEQKRIEQALRDSEAFNVAVLNSLSAHIAVLDAQGTIVAVNAAWQQFASANGAPELALHSVGTSYRKVCEAAAGQPSGDTAMAAWAGIDTVLRHLRDRFTLEYPCHAPDGAQRFFRMTVYPLTAPHGGAVVAHEDITTNWQAAEAMREARLEAERANLAKSRFLAAASHDLRQPLAALGLYVDALDRTLDARNARVLKNMHDCVASLSGLLDDLLDLSKLEADVVTPHYGSFALDELIERVIAANAPEAQARKLSLRVRPSNLIVYSDPVLLQRMLANLVANAIRYTERGGVLIATRCRQGTRWIEVWDTGIGIAPDMISGIFEEFRQLGPRDGRGGSGLGLAIVARTATLLGVRLRVRSTPGKGSMFAIELRPGRTGAAAPNPRIVHRPLRIALVEDNAQVLDALEYALRAGGHEVVAATSGDELLMRLAGTAPDIVVSDYRLRNAETALDVIAAARTHFGATLPALIITGDTDPLLMRAVADSGIAFRHKPLDFESLQSCIAQLTERHAAS